MSPQRRAAILEPATSFERSEKWVSLSGYEVGEYEAGMDIPKTQLDANFFQSPTYMNFLLKRGVIRAKGDERRTYIPSSTKCRIYGHFLAGLLLVQGRAMDSRA